MDWLDIGIHAALAAAWAVLAGYITSGVPALGIALGIACLLFWPLRERFQHGGKWGGRQSQLEWIIPDIVALPSFAAGFLF